MQDYADIKDRAFILSPSTGQGWNYSSNISLRVNSKSVLLIVKLLPLF